MLDQASEVQDNGENPLKWFQTLGLDSADQN